MKGFIPTPRETVDAMVERLFVDRPLRPDDTVLDPGCGTGEFIDGIIRWCKRQEFGKKMYAMPVSALWRAS